MSLADAVLAILTAYLEALSEIEGEPRSVYFRLTVDDLALPHQPQVLFRVIGRLSGEEAIAFSKKLFEIAISSFASGLIKDMELRGQAGQTCVIVKGGAAILPQDLAIKDDVNIELVGMAQTEVTLADLERLQFFVDEVRLGASLREYNIIGDISNSNGQEHHFESEFQPPLPPTRSPNREPIICSSFWEFPPQEWFEDANMEAWPSCLILSFERGIPRHSEALKSQVVACLQSFLEGELQFQAKEPSQCKFLKTPNGARPLVSYNIRNEEARKELYNHICLAVNCGADAWDLVEMHDIKATKLLEISLSRAIGELIARNTDIFNVRPSSEVDGDDVSIVSSIMEVIANSKNENFQRECLALFQLTDPRGMEACLTNCLQNAMKDIEKKRKLKRKRGRDAEEEE